MDYKSIIFQIIDLILSFFQNKSNSASQSIPNIQPVNMHVPASSDQINWNDPKSKISKYFNVGEALWLPSWQVYHIPSEEEKANILEHAKNMDKIREFLGTPLRIHCWIRPVLNNPSSPHHGEDYNALVKGAKNSIHKIGKATDYDAVGMNCDDVRSKLEPKLEEFGVRMERMPGGNWVHNDSGQVPPGGHAYFIP